MVEPEKLREFLSEIFPKPSSQLQFSSKEYMKTQRLRILDAPRGPIARLIQSCMVENTMNYDDEGEEKLLPPESKFAHVFT